MIVLLLSNPVENPIENCPIRTPLNTSLLPNPPLAKSVAPTNTHGTQTRSKSEIYKPKAFSTTKESSTVQEAL